MSFSRNHQIQSILEDHEQHPENLMEWLEASPQLDHLKEIAASNQKLELPRWTLDKKGIAIPPNLTVL